MTSPLHLGIALDRAGWHPAAWRDDLATPDALASPRYWSDLVRTADTAGLVFATIEDALQLPDRFDSEPRSDRAQTRLDAVLVASFLAPLTKRIGLLPAVGTAHPEPFHLATGLQTLDYTSRGRAGVRLVAGAAAPERANFGRQTLGIDALPENRVIEDQPAFVDAFAEAAEVAEALGLLWDSWQDDAIIRDIERGRFLDADRIHNPEFRGRFFSVTGASIVPRSPQGRPPISVLAHSGLGFELAARHADIVFITPKSTRETLEISASLATERQPSDPLLVFADLLVLIEPTPRAAREVAAALDDAAGSPLASDARIVIGDVDDVVDTVRELADGGVDGVRLRPARLPADLSQITNELIPRLRQAGLLRESDETTLRGRLGLRRPESRYVREEARA